MSVFVTSDVPAMMSALSNFGSTSQPDELFDWFWASVDSFIMRVYVDYVFLIPPSCFINSQGFYWGFFIHAHDLIAAAIVVKPGLVIDPVEVVGQWSNQWANN